MRDLELSAEDFTNQAVTVDRLLMGSTDGFLCPNLRRLVCSITRPMLPFIPLFLPPGLTHLQLFRGWSLQDLVCPDLGLFLQILPTQCLQELVLDLGSEAMVHFADQISLTVQRCGDSLRLLNVPVTLGEATVHRILSLKELQVWRNVRSAPPTTPPLSTTFPSLQTFTLSGSAHGWIPWLVRQNKRVPDAYDRPIEHSRPLTTISRLVFSLNATSISPLFLLPNLVVLSLESICRVEFRCAFTLTNQDVTQLSAALPRLEELGLGRPCSANTTPTTISCLLALSVHCNDLGYLDIHFNTTNLASDVRSLSADPGFHVLRSVPRKCPLRLFDLGYLPFPPGVSDEEITTIARVFIDIFPSITMILSAGPVPWDPLSFRIRELQEALDGSSD